MKVSLITVTAISLILVCSFAGTQVVKALNKTITVPDDYPTIQIAVDGANAGDTVFVRVGIYHETVAINKALALIGEDRSRTIIMVET